MELLLDRSLQFSQVVSHLVPDRLQLFSRHNLDLVVHVGTDFPLQLAVVLDRTLDLTLAPVVAIKFWFDEVAELDLHPRLQFSP